MIVFTVELTEVDAANLSGLLDAAVRAEGLRAAKVALELNNKIGFALQMAQEKQSFDNDKGEKK